MEANLEMISNYLLEKENREKDALRRESADLLAETPSHVLTTLPKESDYIKPEETEGAPSSLPGAATPSAMPGTAPVDKPAQTIYQAPTTRQAYVRNFATWADTEKAGDVSQREYANEMIQKMIAEGKNPGEYFNILSMLGSAETPAEKERRERREALGETFRGLGNLIGNAANLYNATRGGTPVDLNTANEKHRARMEQIKAKQDALDEKLRETLVKAKMGDMAAERAEKAAEKKSESEAKAANLKFQRDVYLKEIDNAFKLGQIDAQTAARLKEAAVKADSDKALKALEYEYRVKLKTTPSAGDNKVITSLTGSDGGTWTRNTSLSKEELRELSKWVEDFSPYTTVDKNGKETIDYIGAIADASESGLIPDYILEEKGFKRSKDSARRDKNLGLGIGSNNGNGNKLGIGI